MAMRQFVERGKSAAHASDENTSSDGQPGPPSAFESGPASAEDRVAPETLPKTVPSALLRWMRHDSENLKQLQALEAEHSRFVGADPARRLDARAIGPSRWACRHESSYCTRHFQQLKTSIELAGINVQPIKVRPIAAEPAPPSSAPVDRRIDFEIVFGHLRHRACAELGIPVAAVITQVSDRELFIELNIENRTHGNLSPFEQGSMFMRALDGGLFASTRGLAQALGLELTVVKKALWLAQLPQEVISAFASPLDIRIGWAKPLHDACLADQTALVHRAKRHREGRDLNRAPNVFRELMGNRS
ncbi:ParB/RepB/Spo0J family partition protein [Variovorax paradoxus]|nr:ParB/RepB/Spo0J family partition protein [Variovorax paradoxus]